VKGTNSGSVFDWQSANPSKYPAYVHISTPPVVGTDVTLYGFYQGPHFADAPSTRAGD